jgi:hypothetical protein
MEHPTGDRMKAAFERWRQELAAQAGLTAEIRRELETHLSDCIAGFQRLGMGEEESFLLARQHIGQPGMLRREFDKAMNPTSPWKGPLAIAAWSIYFISFFLPSYTVMRGWQCATLQHVFWPKALQGDLLSIHYQFLLLANLLMLASPWLLARFSRNARQLQWVHHLTLGAMIVVCGFLLQLIAYGAAGGLKIGCFVWMFSFTLLYLSVRVQLSVLRRHPDMRHA